MKTTRLSLRQITYCLIGALVALISEYAYSQPLIIDHKCTDINKIPAEWINQAKADLHIGYGHTSHGSQIPSGMNSISQYFTNGLFDFSSVNTVGKLHFFEGCGYCDDGELIYDLSHEDLWYPSAKKYLSDHPDCNVLIYSWCDIYNHDIDKYLERMDSLVVKYGPGGTDPGTDVNFVYMTGHSNAGTTCEATHEANQKIRDHCIANNRILFDFNDLERWNPDGDYFGDGDAEGNYTGTFNLGEELSYNLPGGGRGNWGNEWLNNNSQDTLALIHQSCSSCAHSDNSTLHCVLKGVAVWWMFARLAGWEGAGEDIPVSYDKNADPGLAIWPNPAHDQISIKLSKPSYTSIKLYYADGRLAKSLAANEQEVSIPVQEMARGWYILNITSSNQTSVHKILLQ